MNIYVYLLCFNESPLLRHSIHHYKKYLPSCKIIIYDNESTDNSVEIAKSLGCDVISWSSGNIQDENIQLKLRNTIWKQHMSGWIIMADMDEYLCVTEQDLRIEQQIGTTILKTKGYEMIGESNTIDLSDIDLQKIKKCLHNYFINKNVCFLKEAIIDMNYGAGCHSCNPSGTIKYSSNEYKIKHMNYLGLPFLINKLTERYKRNEQMRKLGMNVHYTQNVDDIEKRYTNMMNLSNDFE
jgi:glycosyltransferase involved in cell wall biosynthesis